MRTYYAKQWTHYAGHYEPTYKIVAFGEKALRDDIVLADASYEIVKAKDCSRVELAMARDALNWRRAMSKQAIYWRAVINEGGL
jgi:hypothetical protein